MKRNPYLSRLTATYLFPEVQRRKQQFLSSHPDALLISLGIGDTTEPISPFVTQALSKAAAALGTREGYRGYGPEQGMASLREKVARAIYQQRIQPEEVFISDGAKCDLGRLQMLFGNQIAVAVQSPSYPVYIEGSLIQGVEKIVAWPCTPENGFFPYLKGCQKADLIYFCSPNNPTGAVASHAQLAELVAYAHATGALIVFDAAYASYIQDPTLPKSIFEIEGAKQVAIEIGSFSKLAGFTGVRLGWTLVPKELRYEGGESLYADWNRLTTTVFNGASTLAQQGGCAVLEEEGLAEIQKTVHFYLENAKILREGLTALGYEVYGGEQAPYLWVRFRGGCSWEIFQHFLERYQIVTTPGLGFGPAGDEYLRLSAFGTRKAIVEALRRLQR